MKIFLLSDTSSLEENLQKKLAHEIQRHGNKIAYISSSPQEDPFYWFNYTQREYNSIDRNIKLSYFDLSNRFSDKDLENVNNFEIIHLSGGNTFEFLDQVEKRDFGETIRKFLQEKLIIGVSAGAIILTPTIEIALYEDENNVNLKDLTGLSIVDFEFYPHFKSSQNITPKTFTYLNKTKNVIYCATDKDGVFVEDHDIQLFGKIMKLN
jgi:dipeptidase E